MSSLPEAVDVLIVGYGPVGAAAAALLGRYGVRTLIVDKAEDILMAPRAIALDNDALRILQMVGLSENAFPKIGIPLVRMLSPSLGEFARFNTAGKVDGHPKLVTMYQPDLERALRARTEGEPTIFVRTGVEMVELADDGDGVNVVLRMPSSRESVVRARYVVGADGASSTVRNAIGEEFVGKTYTEDWLIVDALGAVGGFDHIEFLCDPNRPTPHMVAPGGRTRWEFRLKPGEAREEMEKESTIARLLERWPGAAAARIERKAVYRFHARTCQRFSRGRVFLAGDAAHVTPPFTGQGLVAGLRDAANLAWKLAWVVHGRASTTILDSYDQERRPHATRLIALAKLMGRLIMPRDRARAMLVHGSIALLRRLPPVRRLIDELGIKSTNAFRKGLFVCGGERWRRGAWVPQGLVRSARSPGVWSDDVLGPGLALVGLGVDPMRCMSERSRRDWSHAGGRTLHFAPRGEPVADGPQSHEDMEGRFVSAAATQSWCIVVRPDRTILHDGPPHDTNKIVRESLRLLGCPAA